jgi:hypothetical protein
MKFLPDNVNASILSGIGLNQYQEKKTLPPKFWYATALLGMLFLSAVTIILTYLVDVKFAFLLLGLFIGIPIAIKIIGSPKFGIIFLLISAYLVMFIYKLQEGVQLGVAMDIIQLLLIIGFFLFQKFHPNWKIFKGPVAYVVLLWVAYNILQVANPFTEARMAWFYTVRSIAAVSLMYFIFAYHIQTLSFLKLLFKIWIGLSVFAAIYALKQEYIGFFAFEEKTFNDPLVISLLFINGVWRKFSIFSDPVAFAYNMVISAVFCATLITGPFSKQKKIVLGSMAVLFITVMLYSGTRGAYVLIPAAFILYVSMHLTRGVIMMAVAGGMFMLFVINVPTSNITLVRFQSAFKPSDDASFNVRKENQKRIQPYIQTHPLGGGLGSTGAWGVRFAPNSFLAKLPPDSGYIRVAVELGWLGLIIFCTFFFVVLRQGILNYYAIRDPELKAYCLGITLVIFTLNIGCYPQEALVQFPVSVFFYFFIAVITLTKKFDDEKQAQLLADNAPLIAKKAKSLN